MLGNCYVVDCAVKVGCGLIPSPRPSPRGRGWSSFPLPLGEVRVRENVLLLRLKRLFHPAIELLLVGFDPAIHVAFDISFG